MKPKRTTVFSGEAKKFMESFAPAELQKTKPKKKRKSTEADFALSLKALLSTHYPDFYAHFDLAGVNVSRTNQVRFRELNKTGFPDLQILGPGGMCAFFELKARPEAVFNQTLEFSAKAQNGTQLQTLQKLNQFGFSACYIWDRTTFMTAMDTLTRKAEYRIAQTLKVGDVAERITCAQLMEWVNFLAPGTDWVKSDSKVMPVSGPFQNTFFLESEPANDAAFVFQTAIEIVLRDRKQLAPGMLLLPPGTEREEPDLTPEWSRERYREILKK